MCDARAAFDRRSRLRRGCASRSNWFNNQQQDLLTLHETLKPVIDNPSTPTVKEQEDEALLGALLKQLTLGDLAVTMASKEPEVHRFAFFVAMRSVTRMPVDEWVAGKNLRSVQET